MFLCSVLESNCVWPSNIKLLWPAVLKSEANQGEREKGERTGNGVRCFRKLSGVDWLIPDGKGHPSWPRKYSLGESSWLVKGKGLGVRDHSGMHIPVPFIHKTLVFNLRYKTIGLPSPSGRGKDWTKLEKSSTFMSIIILPSSNELPFSVTVRMTKLSAAFPWYLGDACK